MASTTLIFTKPLAA